MNGERLLYVVISQWIRIYPVFSFAMKSFIPRLPGRQRQNNGLLRVVPVTGRRALYRFIRVPWSIYADDPVWVPPLLIERHQHLSRRNPYFAHARCRFWIAYRGKQPVGRISAQVDELHLERYQDATGFFGMLDAQNDAAIFRSLLNAAETWLREMGMRRVLGPFNLSINHECGLLVEGFDTPPMVMMGHARPYYAERLEEQGYSKEKDLLAYRLGTDFMIPAVIQAMGKMAGRVRIRPLSKSRLEKDLQIIRDIFEDAWSQNWCFIPFTESEFKDLGRNLMFLVDKNFVQIAEVDGAPTAMIVAFPNLNEIIRDLNGRLLPVGWFKLLWRLKITYPKTGRAVLMGIRKRYQHSLLGAVLAFMVIDAVRVAGVKRGMQEVELSWILEDNTRMRNMLESLGAEVYKRYRIYQKKLK